MQLYLELVLEIIRSGEKKKGAVTTISWSLITLAATIQGVVYVKAVRFRSHQEG